MFVLRCVVLLLDHLAPNRAVGRNIQIEMAGHHTQERGESTNRERERGGETGGEGEEEGEEDSRHSERTFTDHCDARTTTKKEHREEARDTHTHTVGVVTPPYPFLGYLFFSPSVCLRGMRRVCVASRRVALAPLVGRFRLNTAVRPSREGSETNRTRGREERRGRPGETGRGGERHDGWWSWRI